jgi:hypothetical protein
MVSKILLRYFRAIPVLQNRGIQLTDCVATKTDVENHFNSHGTGEITEIKLMNGFGFIEYKDAMDARDVVPGEILAIRARIMAYQTHSLPRFRFYGRASNRPICTWHPQS